MDHNFFNLTKRKKRDILHELLVGRPSAGIISRKELRAVKRLLEDLYTTTSQDKTCKQSTQVQPAKAVRPKTRKLKTTLHLSRENVENLDKARLAIRRLAPENLRSRVTRSRIANAAIAKGLQEFCARGEESRLTRDILQNLSH